MPQGYSCVDENRGAKERVISYGARSAEKRKRTSQPCADGGVAKSDARVLSPSVVTTVSVAADAGTVAATCTSRSEAHDASPYRAEPVAWASGMNTGLDAASTTRNHPAACGDAVQSPSECRSMGVGVAP